MNNAASPMAELRLVHRISNASRWHTRANFPSAIASRFSSRPCISPVEFFNRYRFAFFFAPITTPVEFFNRYRLAFFFAPMHDTSRIFQPLSLRVFLRTHHAPARIFQALSPRVFLRTHARHQLNFQTAIASRFSSHSSRTCSNFSSAFASRFSSHPCTTPVEFSNRFRFAFFFAPITHLLEFFNRYRFAFFFDSAFNNVNKTRESGHKHSKLIHIIDETLSSLTKKSLHNWWLKKFPTSARLRDARSLWWAESERQPIGNDSTCCLPHMVTVQMNIVDQNETEVP